MRATLIAIIFILSITIVPSVQAGALTRGNIFAEGLAGCSVGVAIGLASYLFLATQAPAAGPALVSNFNIFSACVIGGIAAASLHTMLQFSDITKEFFDPVTASLSKAPMVYPATPGKKY